MMQETIQQSGSHGGVTSEDSGPILEGDVGSDDDRAALVAFGDDLKEELCASLVQGQVPQFVDQQNFWAPVMLDLPGELATGFGGAKPVNHVNGGGKQHAMAAQAGCIAQGDGQMAFPDHAAPGMMGTMPGTGLRRALGFELGRVESRLRGFLAFMKIKRARQITTKLVVEFALRPDRSAPTQAGYLSAIRGFAQYLSGIDLG